MGVYAPSYADDVVCEMQATRSENVSDDGITCSVQLMVPDAIRWDVVSDIVGGKVFWPHLLDMEKPPFAISAAIAPFDAKTTQDEQACEYESAILTINYESKGKDPEDLVAESLEPTCEFIQLPHKRFLWGSASGDALTEEEAPAKQFRGLNLSRTIYKIPADSLPDLLAPVGRVNSAAYTSSLLNMTFAAETLLYIPPTLDRTITTDGDPGYTVNMKFAFKPDGWNQFWRAKTGDWSRIWSIQNGATYNNYPLGSFAALLY